MNNLNGSQAGQNSLGHVIIQAAVLLLVPLLSLSLSLSLTLFLSVFVSLFGTTKVTLSLIAAFSQIIFAAVVASAAVVARLVFGPPSGLQRV